MFTQADAAEQILRDSDGPMHHTDIVKEAVTLGTITRTAKNSETLYSNVRKTLSTDTRFVKTKMGTFDLAERYTHATEQKESTTMPNSHSPEEIDRNLEAMLAALDKASGVLEVPMEKIRDVFAHKSIGSKIAQKIEESLRQHELSHFPANLNVRQNVQVLLYQTDSVAGHLVNAVRQESAADARYKEMIDRVREIVAE